MAPKWAPNQALRDGPSAVAWLVPNEGDVAPLREQGQNAFVAWGEFSSRHAERLRGFEGLLLVGVTCDDSGAWEASRRWRVLTEVLSARQVQFRAGARSLWEGATLADHFAEGYTLDETRRVSLRDMRDAIDRETLRRHVANVHNGPLARLATRSHASHAAVAL